MSIGEFPGKLRSSNVCRDNVSREIGRMHITGFWSRVQEPSASSCSSERRLAAEHARCYCRCLWEG